MNLIASFGFDLFVVLMPLFIVFLVYVLYSFFTSDFTKVMVPYKYKNMKLLNLIIVAAFLGSGVGASAITGHQQDIGKENNLYVHNANQDLKQAGFRHLELIKYHREATLLVGRKNCQLTFPIRQVPARSDKNIMWRPVLMNGHNRFGLTSADLSTLAEACS